MKKYDIAIVGAGPGGYVAAIRAAQLGHKVLVIDKEKLGGSCLNWGCIPTKTMLITAKHYKDVLRSEEFGIVGVQKDEIKVDFKKLLKRKDKVVNQLTTGIKMLFKKNKIDFINGEATNLQKNSLEVEDEKIEFNQLIIATGASPKYEEIQGLNELYEDGRAITSKQLMEVEEIPSKLIIIGSNTYAVEYATLFNAIGSEVTLIHADNRILPQMEKEMATTLERQLKKDGVKLVSKATIEAFSKDGVKIKVKEKTETYQADQFMLFMGLQPNMESFENLGLELDPRGFVKTNDKMETSIKNIYAIGDVNGKLPLAHAASAEGIVAVENISGIERSLNYNLIPKGVYSFPELASVGLTEEEAKDQGLDITVSKFPLQANGMAIAEDETVGFVKLISDNQYGEIVGAHIVAEKATDMISKLVAIMQIEGTVHDLSHAVHPHPTLSEAIVEAAYGAIDGSIHI